MTLGIHHHLCKGLHIASAQLVDRLVKDGLVGQHESRTDPNVIWQRNVELCDRAVFLQDLPARTPEVVADEEPHGSWRWVRH